MMEGDLYYVINMAKMTEARSQVSNVIEEQSVVEVLRKAGLDPAKMKPFERNYLESSLSKEMAVWRRDSKPVELEAARWLEGKLAQKHEFLTNTKASPEELRATEIDMQRVHERISTLEKTELVARKIEVPIKSPRMMKKQSDEPEKAGANFGEEGPALQKPYLGSSKPMRTQNERDIQVQQQIVQLGSRKENPFTDEYRIKSMPNVQAGLMDNVTYRKAIEDQNSKFAANQKTAAGMIEDAVEMTRNPKANLGFVSTMYAQAVRDYTKILKVYARDRALGSNSNERIFAGLVSQEKAERIALAKRPAPAMAKMPNLEAEIMTNESYRAALEDHNRRFSGKPKTARDILNDAAAIASRRKADVGPADSPYAIAVAGYVSIFEDNARDQKLGRTPDDRILAGLRSLEAEPAIVQQKPAPVAKPAIARKEARPDIAQQKVAIAQPKTRPKEPKLATVHRYEFTVSGLLSGESSTAYQFSTLAPIDQMAFRHAIDTSTPEAASRNLASLGVSGLSEQAIAEIQVAIRDPAAIIGLAEIKAKKGSKS